MQGSIRAWRYRSGKSVFIFKVRDSILALCIALYPPPPPLSPFDIRHRTRSQKPEDALNGTEDILCEPGGLLAPPGSLRKRPRQPEEPTNAMTADTAENDRHPQILKKTKGRRLSVSIKLPLTPAISDMKSDLMRGLEQTLVRRKSMSTCLLKIVCLLLPRREYSTV